MKVYDEYAKEYDAWFLENQNLLHSEVKLVAHFMHNAGNVLSIGCGSGLFEMILEKEYAISIKNGIEPSSSMAEIARKRGMKVTIGSAEQDILGCDQYDTLLYNGCPSYISDLASSFENAYKALRKRGKIVVIDVPKESGYATLYNLAMTLGTWNHSLLKDVQPPHPYPIEFVKSANWRTTGEKVEILQHVGFKNFQFAQTLTTCPCYSNDAIEEPSEGFSRGSYVAICATK